MQISFEVPRFISLFMAQNLLSTSILQTDAEALLATARANADQILQAAQRELEKAKDARKRRSLPAFVYEANCPLRYNRDGGWDIGFKVTSRLRTIETQHHICRIERAADFTTHLWLPLYSDGGFAISTMTTLHGASLPHVGPEGACLSISDAPPYINTIDHYHHFNRSLARAFSGIQLDSLFDYSISLWPKQLRLAIPPPIRSWIRRGGARTITTLLRSTVDMNLFVPKQEETTWTIRDNNR